MNGANYASKLSDKEREEASTRLGQIPRSRGKFTILGARFGTATATNEHGTLEWLRFDVELSSDSEGAEKTPRPPPSGAVVKAASIRAVDIKAFVETHVGELNPDLADLETDCGEGQKPVQSLAPVRYGDLDGEGQEEAAIEGWSCLSGTGGADFWGVLKLMPDGKIAILPIEPMPKSIKGRNPYQGLRGHIRLEIQEGRLVEIFPTYPDEKACNNCSEGERRFVYRWDGQRFVLDDIIDVPASKTGS
jgi:hypothetical protein